MLADDLAIMQVILGRGTMVEELHFTDDDIRARAYRIWEREGRPLGRSQECWLKAKVELEAECHTTIDGHNRNFVLPRIPVRLVPTRRASAIHPGKP